MARPLSPGSLAPLDSRSSSYSPQLHKILTPTPQYQNFLKLGPGGTPPTPAGYARLTWYRLFTLRDPFLPPPCDPSLLPTSGLLPATPLPYRPGPRPSVAGLAPQRQLTQPGSAAAYASLRASLAALAAREPSRFGTATSSVEKHGFALFARHPLNVCGNGEVVHIHTSDRSMHMNLHPEDIRVLLERGCMSSRTKLCWFRELADMVYQGASAIRWRGGGWSRRRCR